VTLRIRDLGGFVAGLLFLGIGAGAVGIAAGYWIGTPLHMGPGYFPIVLGSLLLIIGTASVLRSLVVAAPRPARIALRPALLVTAAVLVFAGGIDVIGLVPTVFVLAMLACLAGPRIKFREAVLIAAVLSVLAAGIFVFGLKLPFTLFWT
jgi:hypothetical protein